jgi:hypothetical protein
LWQLPISTEVEMTYTWRVNMLDGSHIDVKASNTTQILYRFKNWPVHDVQFLSRTPLTQGD